MQPLRILIVCRGLPFHTLGGMEAVAWDLSRAFASNGAEVTVLTTACADLPPQSVKDGVRIICLKAPSGRYSSAWWRELKKAYFSEHHTTADVVFSISAGARDIVRFRSGPSPVFIMQAHGTAWGEFVSKLRQMSLLAWVKSVRNIASLWEDREYRHFDCLVAVGSVVERDLRRVPTRWVIGSARVELIENGIAEDRFTFDANARATYRSQLGLPTNARAIFCASRLHPQKGIMEAMEGFLLASRSRPELHLVIAGAGPDEARLRARAANSGTADRIHFIGMVPRAELRNWLSAADVFLFSTKRAEGLPLNILEALAAGLPVVASHHVADHRFGAVAVDPNDPENVAAGIEKAIDMLGDDRPSRLAAVFTLKHSAQRYLELFHHLLGRDTQLSPTR